MAQSSLLRSAFGAAILAAACASSPALALDAGQCGTRAEIVQTLYDEGQVELISGQRTAVGLPKDIFTSNANLTLGYNLEAGVGSEAGLICIRAKYTNIRLNGDPQFARPNWASFGQGTAHDEHLAKAEARDGDKVLLGATSIVRGSDGSDQSGPFLMVMRGKPAPGTSYRSAGEATATSRNGGITTLLVMANVEANENFRALAGKRVETAANDSRSFRPR